MNISRRTFLTSLAAVPAIAGLAAGARLLTDDDSSPPRVVAAGPAPTGAWTYRGDSARTGQMPGPGWEAAPVTRWVAALGEPSTSPPAAVDGAVYVGFGSYGASGLVAMDAATGTPRWTWAGPDPDADYTTPAILGGVAYTASTDGHLYAISASPTGTATPIAG